MSKDRKKYDNNTKVVGKSAFLILLAMLLVLNGCRKKEQEAPDDVIKGEEQQEENPDKDDENEAEGSDNIESNQEETIPPKLTSLYEQKISAKIKGELTPDEVLKDVGNIDLYHKMNTDGMTKKTEEDVESSTSVDFYYNADNVLIYEDYNGYGEDCFAFHTSSVSGKGLKVLYVDEEGERAQIQISGPEYSISFHLPDKASLYGAKEIYVTISKGSSGDLPEVVTYCVLDNGYYIESARFYEEDGYHCYSGYPEEDGFYEDEYCKITKRTEPVTVADGLSVAWTDEKIADIQMLLGNHTFSYLEQGDKKEWYLTADIYLVFDDAKKAEEYAAQYGCSVEEWYGDDRYMIAIYEKMTFSVSEKFPDFVDFMQEEFNDYIFRSVTFDENFSVSGFKDSDIFLSYY